MFCGLYGNCAFQLISVQSGSQMETSPARTKSSGGSPSACDRRNDFVVYESVHIFEKRTEEREKMKAKLWEESRKKLGKTTKDRQDRINRWVRRTANSPFAVDLLAEDERVAEDTKIRAEEDARQRRELEARKAKAKNAIILRALEESSDLEALRREKRAILQEEKRLKALLATERSVLQAKQDRIAAVRAEKNRRAAKAEYRRKQYQDILNEEMELEAAALSHKHGIKNSRKFVV